jgi:predicted Zn-dependent protease
MGVHPATEHFDVVAKVQRYAGEVSVKPESAIRTLLRIARLYGAKKCERSETEKAAALKALEAEAGRIQDTVIAQFPDNFQVNWLTARLMHRMGRNKDALSFLRAAEKLNEGVRGVPFRKAEILSDMHGEIPVNGYGREAFGIAVSATMQYPTRANILFAAQIGWRALTQGKHLA